MLLTRSADTLLCNLMGFLNSTCWFISWLHLRDELRISHDAFCFYIYWLGREGADQVSCILIVEKHIGHKTVSVCSLLNCSLCRLAPASPRRRNVLKWRVAHLSCSALPLCDRWACATVWACGAHLPNPLLSQENGEQLRGGGRWMQRTGEGGGGSNGKRLAGRGVRHKVRSILFSYLLRWMEEWLRGDPKHFLHEQSSKEQRLHFATLRQELFEVQHGGCTQRDASPASEMP